VQISRSRRFPTRAKGDSRFEFSCRDYRNRVFSGFYLARAPTRGPGWYIWGRNPEYGGRLVRLCGWPDVRPRKHPHYNIRVRRGWLRRSEAQQVLDHVLAQISTPP